MKRLALVMPVRFPVLEWLNQSLQSILKQKLPWDWELELRVGADHCEEASAALAELGVGHWMAPRRVGPHILRNSLAALAPFDALAFFDADDRMHDWYLYHLLRRLRASHQIIGPFRLDTGWRKPGRWFHGIPMVTAEAWAALGGLRGWMVAADEDLVARAKLLGIPCHGVRKAVYNRRLHPGSTNASTEWGLWSRKRAELLAEGARLRAAGDLVAPYERVPLEWRG